MMFSTITLSILLGICLRTLGLQESSSRSNYSSTTELQSLKKSETVLKSPFSINQSRNIASNSHNFVTNSFVLQSSMDYQGSLNNSFYSTNTFTQLSGSFPIATWPSRLASTIVHNISTGKYSKSEKTRQTILLSTKKETLISTEYKPTPTKRVSETTGKSVTVLVGQSTSFGLSESPFQTTRGPSYHKTQTESLSDIPNSALKNQLTTSLEINSVITSSNLPASLNSKAKDGAPGFSSTSLREHKTKGGVSFETTHVSLLVSSHGDTHNTSQVTTILFSSSSSEEFSGTTNDQATSSIDQYTKKVFSSSSRQGLMIASSSFGTGISTSAILSTSRNIFSDVSKGQERKTSPNRFSTTSESNSETKTTITTLSLTSATPSRPSGPQGNGSQQATTVPKVFQTTLTAGGNLLTLHKFTSSNSQLSSQNTEFPSSFQQTALVSKLSSVSHDVLMSSLTRTEIFPSQSTSNAGRKTATTHRSKESGMFGSSIQRGPSISSNKLSSTASETEAAVKSDSSLTMTVSEAGTYSTLGTVQGKSWSAGEESKLSKTGDVTSRVVLTSQSTESFKISRAQVKSLDWTTSIDSIRGSSKENATHTATRPLPSRARTSHGFTSTSYIPEISRITKASKMQTDPIATASPSEPHIVSILSSNPPSFSMSSRETILRPSVTISLDHSDMEVNTLVTRSSLTPKGRLTSLLTSYPPSLSMSSREAVLQPSVTISFDHSDMEVNTLATRSYSTPKGRLTSLLISYPPYFTMSSREAPLQPSVTISFDKSKMEVNTLITRSSLTPKSRLTSLRISYPPSLSMLPRETVLQPSLTSPIESNRTGFNTLATRSSFSSKGRLPSLSSSYQSFSISSRETVLQPSGSISIESNKTEVNDTLVTRSSMSPKGRLTSPLTSYPPSLSMSSRETVLQPSVTISIESKKTGVKTFVTRSSLSSGGRLPSLPSSYQSLLMSSRETVLQPSGTISIENNKTEVNTLVTRSSMSPEGRVTSPLTSYPPSLSMSSRETVLQPSVTISIESKKTGVKTLVTRSSLSSDGRLPSLPSSYQSLSMSSRETVLQPSVTTSLDSNKSDVRTRSSSIPEARLTSPLTSYPPSLSMSPRETVLQQSVTTSFDSNKTGVSSRFTRSSSSSEGRLMSPIISYPPSFSLSSKETVLQQSVTTSFDSNKTGVSTLFARSSSPEGRLTSPGLSKTRSYGTAISSSWVPSEVSLASTSSSAGVTILTSYLHPVETVKRSVSVKTVLRSSYSQASNSTRGTQLPSSDSGGVATSSTKSLASLFESSSHDLSSTKTFDTTVTPSSSIAVNTGKPPENPTQFEATMILKMAWNPQYKRSYTPEYQALALEIERQLTASFAGSVEGFLSVQVTRLWESSVGVDFIVFVKQNDQVNQETVEKTIIEANRTGVFKLPLTSVEVKEIVATSAPPPEDESIEPWVIVLIVACIVVFLLLVVIVVLVLKLTRGGKYKIGNTSNNGEHAGPSAVHFELTDRKANYKVPVDAIYDNEDQMYDNPGYTNGVELQTVL